MLKQGIRQSVIFFLLLLQTVFCQKKTGALIISEIMFNAASPNSEFVEIFNASSTDTLDLSGLAIQYHFSSPDTIIQAGAAALLPPKSFAVIFEGDYDLTTGIYKVLPGKSTLVLKIRSTAFGSAGMSNTSDRTVILAGPGKDTLDVYTYSADNDAGISDEKIILELQDSPSIWANSLKKNGTPGCENSVQVNAWKLEIDSLIITPVNPEHNDEVGFSAAVTSTGFLAVHSIRLFCFNDFNADSVGSDNELIDTAGFASLDPGNTVRFYKTIGKLSYGYHRILIKAEYENQKRDKFTGTYFFTIPVSRKHAQKHDIVINEIMYAPPAGEPEWIEITNRSADDIDLRKWRIADNVSKVSISSSGRILHPGGFLILTGDTLIKRIYDIPSQVIQINLPALNNTGDSVVLSDSSGMTIDSVAYSPQWGGSKGTSLERIYCDSTSLLSSNWRSPEGKVKATPGIINSVAPLEHDISLKLKWSPEYIFTGGSAKVILSIKNAGRKRSSIFSVMIFHIADEDSASSADELIWQAGFLPLEPGDSSEITSVFNGLREGKNLLAARATTETDDRPENNLVLFDISCIRINEQRGDLVINEVMYAPDPGKCEWIELFNNSSKDILFSRFKVANHSDTSSIVSVPAVIHPSQYFVICRDSSFLTDYPAVRHFVMSRIPIFSNQGDIVIILDSLSRVIDSVKYSPTWGGSSGISLERINPSASSASPLNWKSSRSQLKATPGSKNSASPPDFDVEVKRLYITPLHPEVNDSISFTAEIKNSGLKKSNLYIELTELSPIDSAITKILDKAGSFDLTPGDSVIFTFPFRLLPPVAEKLASVRVFSENDENSSNNSICITITPGIEKGALLINEIMFAPSNGEPEWVELFNSGKYPLSIRGCSTADETNPIQLHKVTDAGISVDSKQFLVLAADSSFFSIHPAVACPVIITDLPVFNNDMDAVVIKDINRNTVDSLFYSASWGGAGGYSLERVSSGKASAIRENWGQCRDPIKSTPGRTNSLSQKDFDLELTDIFFDPHSALAGEKITVYAKIKNTGTSDISGFSIAALYLEYNSGSEHQLDKLDNLFLKASDSLTVKFASVFNLRCSTKVSVQIISASDQDSANNKLHKVIAPGFIRGTILINEFMPDPVGNEPEWIELVNNSAISVNLKDWAISVSAAQYKTVISDRDLIIEPGKMAVAARDSSLKHFYPGLSFAFHACRFRQLGNFADIISLYDQKNNLIDSLNYKPAWHKIRGRSLERFSPEGNACDSSGWAPSLHRMKATPGSHNSITGLPGYKRNSLVINEILYNPANGNSEFVELYNPNAGNIDIAGWQIYQKSGDYFTLSDSSFLIQSGSYFVLASDSSIFSNYSYLKSSSRCSISSGTLGFLKDGDRIVLKDIRGNVIDSLHYYDTWHTKPESETKNTSLERYSPQVESNLADNWHSSYNSAGATPDSPNSIKPPDVNSRNGFSVFPNPFSPDNDGFEDITHIDVDTEENVDAIRIRIYTSNGVLVRTLYSKSLGRHQTIDFDGRNEEGEALRIGIYIILIEKISADSAPSEAIKSVVVIARKL